MKKHAHSMMGLRHEGHHGMKAEHEHMGNSFHNHLAHVDMHGSHAASYHEEHMKHGFHHGHHGMGGHTKHPVVKMHGCHGMDMGTADGAGDMSSGMDMGGVGGEMA